ncbi:C69 family dipeptidase [Phenylobacterium sp.]|jgi:dipeptidase|uniref:C69 family dipeptidase n=1 Tax=Phenylobacterium sp. TaxID=1871053 RepID=UPI002F3F3B57
MCDTLTALRGSTARGATLFAKNSDRERNEAQALEMTPRRSGGGALRLTYITIEDAAATHACLLSRPFWMWGAEMGVNEYGVAIGNEALHALIPAQRTRALTGMDLVRLGLERATSAAEAVEVMIELLERHGQGGDCGHLSRFYYHNGFLIADAREAYVLETVGRWWVVERVKHHRAISNAYSIGKSYEAVSDNLAAFAREQGWTGFGGRFDVAAHLSDEARETEGFGRARCARGGALLSAASPRLRPEGMMAILRDHGEAADWNPAGAQSRTICMHAAKVPRRSQSVGSLVSELRPERTVHWITGTAAPCTSLFKPVLFEVGLPYAGPEPNDWYDSQSLWWRHEMTHRAMLADLPSALAAIAPQRDALEADFVALIDEAFDEDEPEALHRAVIDCWREAAEAEARWAQLFTPAPPAGRSSHARSWARLNQVAGLPRT